ncbi:regulator of G-protein signaling rgs-2-like isoform X1 [Montipora foliosa]|uniref:regulator of G-protein signaling rgs-2-like isoform X1 n=2 Tax=Montipora foliosa TaxID=591990 RepID=UPI0035F19ACE
MPRTLSTNLNVFVNDGKTVMLKRLTKKIIKPMGGCSSSVAPEDPNAQHTGKTNWCVCCSRHDSAAALLARTERDLDCERPSPEEAKKWQTSFESMLKHRFGVQLFQDFLRSQYGEENLNFWLAVEEYKKVDEESRTEKARMIYEDFVSTLSPTEISLDAKVRAEIDNNMNNPTEETFKVAQDHIFTLMYHDCFPRFIKSKHYKQLLKKH